MAAETKTSVVKVKPSSQDAKGKEDWSVTRKKIESSLKRPVDFKNKSPPPLIKSEVKTKTILSSSKTTTTKTTTKTTVRAKKVYTLAGQKYDPPEEREPLRIFYESLSKQIPSSEMAEFWMMEHGLLSPEKAKKASEKKQRRQKQIRMGTPIKSPPPPPSRPESSHSQKQQQASRNGDMKAKKRIIKESDDDDDDFIVSPKKRKW